MRHWRWSCPPSNWRQWICVQRTCLCSLFIEYFSNPDFSDSRTLLNIAIIPMNENTSVWPILLATALFTWEASTNAAAAAATNKQKGKKDKRRFQTRKTMTNQIALVNSGSPQSKRTTAAAATAAFVAASQRNIFKCNPAAGKHDSLPFIFCRAPQSG